MFAACGAMGYGLLGVECRRLAQHAAQPLFAIGPLPLLLQLHEFDASAARAASSRSQNCPSSEYDVATLKRTTGETTDQQPKLPGVTPHSPERTVEGLE